MKRTLLTLAFLALSAARSHAEPSLSWDACLPYGHSDATYPCAPDTFADRLVAAVRVPVSIDNPVGIEAWLAIRSSWLSLRDWWRVVTPGDCRAGALAVDMGREPSGHCRSLFEGTTPTVSVEMCVNCGPQPIPSIGYLRVAATASGMRAITAIINRVAFQLVLDHSRVAGDGACAGCIEPADIMLLGMRIDDANTGPHEYCAASQVWWQGGIFNTTTNFPPSPWSPCYSISFDRTEPHTWGKVKTIYR